mmetsp:Transcript_132924/g.231002  ORF Transcript_132924/g.231002 Transcript_132924/m.231002 type:complete len:370 (-) Transcript_132924:64-1173(-)
MKSLRNRMKTSLTISTNRSAKVGPMTMKDEKKSIRNMTEAEFREMYTLKGEVMESTNKGMSVLFATRMVDGMEVVIKVRERSKSFTRASEEKEWCATTEVQMNMPPTDTICQLIDVIATRHNYYVVMEKVEGKDLFEQMADEHMQQSDVREVVYQILDALKVLHTQGRIHKDLKLENVMVDMNSTKEPCSPGGKGSRKSVPGSPKTKGASPPHSPAAKLIDFDTVEAWEPDSPKARDVLGTDGYIAPEAYLGEYSPASDVYCVGVIMYKLLTHKFPSSSDIFDDGPGENFVGHPAMMRIHERLKAEKINFAQPPLNRSPEAADLVSKMLRFDPSARPSAEEALAHTWFKMPAEELSPPAVCHADTRKSR